jgi:hypothetical protein
MRGQSCGNIRQISFCVSAPQFGCWNPAFTRPSYALFGDRDGACIRRCVVLLHTQTTGPLIKFADSLNELPSPVNPPFPALVSLHIGFGLIMQPSPQLINILSSISSTPSLSSIAIEHFLWDMVGRVHSGGQWIDLDRCLVQLVMNAAVGGGLA